MKIILQEGNQYVLRFERGEELIEGLKQFCEEQKITAGFFVGLGACSYLKLAFYNLLTKQYEEREFNETLEIASLTGNVAVLNEQLIIHAHGTFSDKTLVAIAGHVSKLIIGGAGEIKFDKFDTTMKRKSDAITGLNLLE
ncbi:MAG TPA: PPC domain-containing DNA-binding protein [Patescibacteria group bacterium]|jgi:hypothetical protein|nr:PPC domain-containing DNA-binding protein [Patescibacteria group bacterium]